MSNTWTLEEYENVFFNYSMQGNNLLSQLKNRAPLTVRKKASILGQNEPCNFTQQESDFITHHGKTLKSATAFFLNGHSPKEVETYITSL